MKTSTFLVAVAAALFFSVTQVGADSGPGSEAQSNYCKDPKSTAQWKEMLSKTPNDPILTLLLALRGGLCQMIDAGKVKLDVAIEIWDMERAKAIEERRREPKNPAENSDLKARFATMLLATPPMVNT